MRLIVLNIVPVSALAALAHAGYADRFIDNPALGVSCGLIAAVFVAAVVALALGNASASEWFGRRLVVLGLLGTVLGFIVALSGVDPSKAADVTSVTPMVATLIQGMSIALYTTLVGTVCKLWLDVLVRWSARPQ